MIRINLAQKKQASYSAKAEGEGESVASKFDFRKFLKGSGGSGGGADLLPLVGKTFVPLVLCAGLYFGYDYYSTNQLEEMKKETTIAQKEKDRIQDELKRIKGFETVKAELERNDLILRTKIDTIEKLIKGRDFTVKSLVTLSQSLPKEVWLTELQATEIGFDFKGGTVDISVISDLMTKLGQTIYFKDVTLKSTAVEATGKLANFELTARRE